MAKLIAIRDTIAGRGNEIGNLSNFIYIKITSNKLQKGGKVNFNFPSRLRFEAAVKLRENPHNKRPVCGEYLKKFRALILIFSQFRHAFFLKFCTIFRVAFPDIHYIRSPRFLLFLTWTFYKFLARICMHKIRKGQGFLNKTQHPEELITYNDISHFIYALSCSLSPGSNNQQSKQMVFKLFWLRSYYMIVVFFSPARHWIKLRGKVWFGEVFERRKVFGESDLLCSTFEFKRLIRKLCAALWFARILIQFLTVINGHYEDIHKTRLKNRAFYLFIFI